MLFQASSPAHGVFIASGKIWRLGRKMLSRITCGPGGLSNFVGTPGQIKSFPLFSAEAGPVHWPCPAGPLRPNTYCEKGTDLRANRIMALLIPNH